MRKNGQDNFIARLWAKLTEWTEQYKQTAEFIRYALVSLSTKFVNIGVEALTRFCMEPWAYATFLALISSASDNVIVSAVSTSVGFVSASAVEYVFSCLFVFEKNKRGNTPLGFVAFMLLSMGGLLIHVLAKFVGENLLGCPWVIVNVIAGFFVLAYNYITKKFLLFNKK